MDKIQIVKQAYELLPDELANGSISLNGTVLPLLEYMEAHIITIVKDTTTPEYLASIIETRFKDKIKPGKTRIEKEAAIDSFLNSLFDRKEELRLSEDTVINIRDYMVTNGIPNMDNDFLIAMGPHKRTIQEYYLTILANEYQPYTKAERAETCISFIGYINDDVLDYILPEFNISFRSYIEEVLPDMLVNITDVEVDGKTIGVDEHIKHMQDQILETLQSSIEIPGLKPEEVFYGNPLRVGEITFSMAPDQTVKVASDTPFIPLAELTDEERYNVMYHEGKNLTLTEDIVITRLNNLMDAVRNVTTEHDLTNIEKEFAELKGELKPFIGVSYITQKVASLENLIQEKRKNIIKSEGNKEDYIDAVQGRITTLKESLRDSQDIEEYARVFGEMTAIQNDVLAKGISDYQLHATIEAFMRDISFRRLKTDALTKNQSKDLERLKNQIDDYIRQIKQDVYYMESENKLSSITGIQIRIERAYDETLSFINDAQHEGLLSSEEAEYYKTQLDNVISNINDNKKRNMQG